MTAAEIARYRDRLDDWEMGAAILEYADGLAFLDEIARLNHILRSIADDNGLDYEFYISGEGSKGHGP